MYSMSVLKVKAAAEEAVSWKLLYYIMFTYLFAG